MICEVEVFKYFNKVMGALPKKTQKKEAESKKKTTKQKQQKRRNHCAVSRKKPRERQHFLQRNGNLRFYYICFQYLFSISGFS